MSKRRWMKSVLVSAEAEVTLPWARGARRAKWKTAVRARALAA